MNRALSKGIMLRSKLKKYFLKSRTEENRNNCSKQRNTFESLEKKKLRDNKEL